MSETVPTVPVLRYAQYVSGDPATTHVYSYVQFCGACEREIQGNTTERKPHDINGHEFGGSYDHHAPSVWAAFCAWCGAKFDDEWWRDQPVRNARVIDHYGDPGTHAGDEHIFEGFTPHGHWLATNDDSTCWCEPEIEPTITHCVVRHRDVPRVNG